LTGWRDFVARQRRELERSLRRALERTARHLVLFAEIREADKGRIRRLSGELALLDLLEREATCVDEEDGVKAPRAAMPAIVAACRQHRAVPLGRRTFAARRLDRIARVARIRAKDQERRRALRASEGTHMNERDRGELVARITDYVGFLGDDELAVLAAAAEGLARGHKVYGDLQLERDQRDFVVEAGDELRDAIVYVAAELVRLRRLRRVGAG